MEVEVQLKAKTKQIDYKHMFHDIPTWKGMPIFLAVLKELEKIISCNNACRYNPIKTHFESLKKSGTLEQ